MEHEDSKSREHAPGMRVRSNARTVPLSLIVIGDDGMYDDLATFYVSKAQFEDGLKFIAESPDAYIRQARARHIFSNLIAMSRK